MFAGRIMRQERRGLNCVVLTSFSLHAVIFTTLLGQVSGPDQEFHLQRWQPKPYRLSSVGAAIPLPGGKLSDCPPNCRLQNVPYWHSYTGLESWLALHPGCITNWQVPCTGTQLSQKFHKALLHHCWGRSCAPSLCWYRNWGRSHNHHSTLEAVGEGGEAVGGKHFRPVVGVFVGRWGAGFGARIWLLCLIQTLFPGSLQAALIFTTKIKKSLLIEWRLFLILVVKISGQMPI